MSPPQTTTETAASWAPYQLGEDTPWNLQRVVHLHRRAALAANWSELQRDLESGPAAAIDRLLAGEQALTEDQNFQAMAQTIGDAAMASGNAGRLKAWWLYRMLMSPDPLGERLVLMWHNHFATSNRKVDDLVKMREQNELFRKHAMAPFAQLLEATIKHPAMLVWLDADSNRKGHPNENLARELMELFTLGIGNYSEEDIKEAARAVTGWTIKGGHFEFREVRHDDGEKMLLGVRGPLSGEQLVQRLACHPATARRIAWRLCHTFLGEGVVDEPALSRLADGLSARELDIRWGVETILRSELFFSEANLRSRISGPVGYIIGALRALELIQPPPSTLLLADWAARMGQDLFYPPNVGGWNEGRAWLGSRASVARANFARALTSGQLWHPSREPDLQTLVGRHHDDVSPRSSATWLATLLWGEAPDSIIEPMVDRILETQAPKPLATMVTQLMARPEHFLA